MPYLSRALASSTTSTAEIPLFHRTSSRSSDESGLQERRLVSRSDYSSPSIVDFNHDSEPVNTSVPSRSTFRDPSKGKRKLDSSTELQGWSKRRKEALRSSPAPGRPSEIQSSHGGPSSNDRVCIANVIEPTRRDFWSVVLASPSCSEVRDRPDVPKGPKTRMNFTTVTNTGPLQGHTTQYQNQGYLAGAHNVVIKDSNLCDIKMIQNEPGSKTLKWLDKYNMAGAEFNSDERDPPPRCHPGTRTSIVERIDGWIDNTRREKRALWLRGPAGVGKSAIVQTLAERLSLSKRLGASLFFSRPNGRSNPRQVFPTLAYQLATQDPGYKEYLTEVMSRNPRSLDKAMSEQFQVLITEPFVGRNVYRGQTPLVFALDGLDECGPEPVGGSTDQSNARRGRTTEEVHVEIVRLIARFVQSYPSAPLIWIIASRPEVHLKTVFASDSVLPVFWEEDIPVDSDEACRDVEKFLHASFTTIREDYAYYFHGNTWPTHEQFLLIAKAASGLFVFAEVIIRFIGDPRVANPISQLKYVLSAVSEFRLSQDQTNPLAVLDAIYTAILSKIPATVWENTRKLLQLLIFLNQNQSLVMELTIAKFPLRLIYEYLEMPREDAIAALWHLHSVIHFSGVEEVDSTRPRFYHASFRDYLKDPSRSSRYSIKELDQFDFGYLWSSVSNVIPELFGSTPVARILPMKTECSQEESYRLLGDILRNKDLMSGVSVSLMGRRCFLSGVQIQSILEGLNFEKMLRDDWHNGFQHLRLWDLDIDELKFCGVVDIFHLRPLSRDRGVWLHSNMEERQEGLVIDLAMLGKRHDLCAPFRTAFEKLLSDAPDTLAHVWGFNPRESCVVIQPCNLPDYWPSPKQPLYIIGL